MLRRVQNAMARNKDFLCLKERRDVTVARVLK